MGVLLTRAQPQPEFESPPPSSHATASHGCTYDSATVILVDAVIGQMRIPIAETPTGCGIHAAGEADKALFVQIHLERFEAGHHNVQAEIEFSGVD